MHVIKNNGSYLPPGLFYSRAFLINILRTRSPILMTESGASRLSEERFQLIDCARMNEYLSCVYCMVASTF